MVSFLGGATMRAMSLRLWLQFAQSHIRQVVDGYIWKNVHLVHCHAMLDVIGFYSIVDRRIETKTRNVIPRRGVCGAGLYVSYNGDFKCVSFGFECRVMATSNV